MPWTKQGSRHRAADGPARAGSRRALVFTLAVLASRGATVDAAPATAVDPQLVQACAACHVADASAPDAAPRLAGQPVAYLARQLRAFQAGDRKHHEMRPIARALAAADIDRLAAYWSGASGARPRGAATPISKMQFPPEFPRGFVLYSTGTREAKRLVTQAYVNRIGLEAARTGSHLPDGSVIIVVDHAARLGPDGAPIRDAAGRWVAGDVAYYEGMEARAGWGQDVPPLLRNLNWNYAVFEPDRTPRGVNQAGCLSCHLPAASNGYVFGLENIHARAAAM